MVAQHYRWDFIGLSTDDKPTPATSEKVTDGSTFYCSDTSKLYVYCKDNWYERLPLGGGGGSTYTAGDGIDITNDVISATNTGKARELTSADYNYPTNNPTSVALWMLPVGLYYWNASVSVRAYEHATLTDTTMAMVTNLAGGSADSIQIYCFYKSGGQTYAMIYFVNSSTGAYASVVKGIFSDMLASASGTSTEVPMSQNATTSMVFADPSTQYNVQIGTQSSATGGYSVAVGKTAQAGGNRGVAIGINSAANGQYSVAFAGSETNLQGVFQVGLVSGNNNGYNNTAYRLLTGLYDPQSAHDAATKGYVDGKILSGAGAPTTSTTGTVGQIYQDTTNGKLYICTAIVPGTDPDPDTYTWTEVGAGGGGSGFTQLTTSDYDYPTNNPTMVAAWKLDPGVYETSGNSVRVGFATALYTDFADKTSFTVIKNGYSDTSYIICGTADNQAPSVYVTKTSTGATEFGAPISLLSDIFADQSTKKKIQIGSSASANGNNSVAVGASSGTGSSALESVAIGRGSGSSAQYTVSVGSSSQAKSDYAISIGNLAGNTSSSNSRSLQIGYNAQSTASNAIALGAYSKATTAGEMNIGTGSLSSGYNASTYRLLSGLYDGQSNHDAATVAQGNKLMTTAPATTDAGVLGQLWTDTTNMHTYQLTAIDTTDPDNPAYTWTQRW